jgi:hypothetical protein
VYYDREAVERLRKMLGNDGKRRRLVEMDRM